MSSEVNERQSIGRLASPLLMQKREASAALARICHFIGEGSVSSSSHSKRGETCRDIHTNGNRAEIQEAYRRHIPQVKEHGPSIKKLDITYNYEQLKQPKESRRTEMKMQEFKAESADFCPPRIEQTQAESENRERAHQGTGTETPEDVEEFLKRTCYSEAERTQELRTYDFSCHELRESQSTVNQRTVQVQELHDRVNSLHLNDLTDLHDPEIASSSRLSHVPTHPLIVPSSFGKLWRGCRPQPDTRNLCNMPGNVFVDPSAPDEPTASSLVNVYARSPTATCGANRASQAQRDPQRELMKQMRTLKVVRFIHQDLPDTCRLGILTLARRRLVHKITWLDSRRI